MYMYMYYDNLSDKTCEENVVLQSKTRITRHEFKPELF